MPLDVRRFTPSAPPLLEAVQVTETNVAEVAQWAGPGATSWTDLGPPTVRLERTSDRPAQVATVGCWIARGITGHLFVHDDAHFTATYTEVS